MSSRLMPRALSVLLALAASLLASAAASAQWTVTILHPEGATQSAAAGGEGGQQVGEVVTGNGIRASLWFGSAASLVDLHPAGAIYSAARRSRGGRQVGWAHMPDNSDHASLWSGSAASWIDLHPFAPGIASHSEALSGGADQQVGYVYNEAVGFEHASLWTGSAESWIDLNPAGAYTSFAMDCDDGQQVGYADFGSGPAHAGLWAGTAASWVDLNPPGADGSVANGVSSGQQVGTAYFGSSRRAGLWNGTAASWHELHPTGMGAVESEALDTDGVHQVGVLIDGLGFGRPCIWSGTPASCVDLNESLPWGYTDGVASDVWSDLGFVYVAGSAFNVAAMRREAIVWSRPLAPQERCVEAVRTEFWTETDGAPGDELGTAAAVWGDTAVLGAPGDDTAAGVNAGSVYVYRNVDGLWTLEAKLAAAEAAAGDEFGAAVAIEGDTIVVGAPRSNSAFTSDTGAVYVFTRQPGGTTWTQQARLVASDRAADDYLGSSVSFSGSRIVAGAPGDGSFVGMTDIGAAYVFVQTGGTWLEEDKITASDGAAEDVFGVAASIFGDTLVVGAIGEESGGGNTDRGAAYVFIRSGSTWTEQAKLTAADGAGGDAFGVSVSVAQDQVIVGANGANLPGALNTGAAYVFVRSGVTWSQQAKLTAQDAEESDFFGSSVSLADSRAVIGAAGADTVGGSGAGAAYVFVGSGTDWTQEQKVSAADGAAGDGFGNAVALSSTTVIVGSSGDDTPDGLNAGSGHVFTLSDDTWSQQAKLVASEASPPPFHFIGVGWSVAVSGDWAVIGNSEHVDAADNMVGAAYVYERTPGGPWVHHSTLLASDSADLSGFGRALSMCDDTLVVGAFAAGSPQGGFRGAAYVFKRSSTGEWTEQQKLFADDGEPADYFGLSVAVSGDIIAVAAPSDDADIADTNEGSVYLFKRAGSVWSLQDKVVASDASASHRLGVRGVTLSNETVVASRDTVPGSVYVFVQTPGGSDWVQQAQIFAPPGIEPDGFGSSLAVDANTLVIGSPFTEPDGAAVVFNRSGAVWTPQQVVVPISPPLESTFGLSCALDQQTLVIADPEAGTPGSFGPGAAYVFTRSESSGVWVERSVVEMPSPSDYDGFGSSVDVSDTTLIVGAVSDDTLGGSNAGSVHVFRLDSSFSPAITTHPVSVAACGSGEAAFSIAAAGTPPLAYQWQLELEPGSDVWVDVVNGVMPGIGTFDISIPEVMVASALSGALSLTTRCIVTNDCGATTSNEAALTNCAADYDCNGVREVPDIFTFLTDWFANVPAAYEFGGTPGVPAIFAFLTAWFAGCG